MCGTVSRTRGSVQGQPGVAGVPNCTCFLDESSPDGADGLDVRHRILALVRQKAPHFWLRSW
jgi:hypothetical protein